eukprot:scaffold75024_cov30-Prasinocladus_malaysianus.AAC.1
MRGVSDSDDYRVRMLVLALAAKIKVRKTLPAISGPVLGTFLYVSVNLGRSPAAGWRRSPIARPAVAIARRENARTRTAAGYKRQLVATKQLRLL